METGKFKLMEWIIKYQLLGITMNYWFTPVSNSFILVIACITYVKKQTSIWCQKIAPFNGLVFGYLGNTFQETHSSSFCCPFFGIFHHVPMFPWLFRWEVDNQEHVWSCLGDDINIHQLAFVHTSCVICFSQPCSNRRVHGELTELTIRKCYWICSRNRKNNHIFYRFLK